MAERAAGCLPTNTPPSRRLRAAARATVAALTGLAALLDGGAAANAQTIPDIDASTASILQSMASEVAPASLATGQAAAFQIPTPPAADTPPAVGGGRRSVNAVRRIPKPGEFERVVAGQLGRPIPRFGSALFLEAANGFAPSTTAAVPPDYLLNPGDELVIGLTGSVEASNLRVTIDNEGRVFIPRVGAVRVAGVRYGDLQTVLSKALARQYRDFTVAAGVGRLHGIRIYVTGYAVNPGAYSVSSLSTLVNGVLAAGGPSVAGSFRSIQLRRQGRLIADLDLYDLLLRGDKTHDAVLENEDVLYIAPVVAEVAVTGSVNAEAIYEAKPDETVADVLSYAGGLGAVADTRRVLIWRVANQDKQGWEELPADSTNRVPVERGDILRVLSSVDYVRPIERQAVLATIDGEVARPGQYYLKPGATLGDALQVAGGVTPGAFLFGTEFNRESVRQQQQANIERAIRELEFMTLAKMLGRFTDSSAAADEAQRNAQRAAIEQLRNHKPEGRIVLSVAAEAPSLPTGLTLENNDRIHIPPRPATVGVFGAVYQPGSFLFRPNLTLADYLRLSGGAEKIADRSGIFVIRANGSVVAVRHGLLAQGALGERALPGDVVFVPIQTDSGMFWERLKSITQVFYQSSIGAAALKVLAK